MLSLDCFDTLLWRKVAKPVDVFYELQQNKIFRESGMSAVRRAVAESRLRRLRQVQSLPIEVNLYEIYRHALPDATNALVRSLVEAEISAEKHLCTIFEPVFDLLTKAKKSNLKTMVVSDTYLNTEQLKDLIDHCLKKAGVHATIDYIFASSDLGSSKGDGLFRKVLKRINVSASKVVHIGDNVHSDHDGARKAGVRGFLFDQFFPSVKSAMSDLDRVSLLMLPHVRDTHPLTNRWKSIWARTDDEQPPEIIGKYTLGPVLYNFVDWIADHADQLKREGERPRLVFLLRDGYSSRLAAQKFAEVDPRLRDVPITELEASRFVAFGSTFTNRDSVVSYLAEHARAPIYEAILRQLLFTTKESAQISARYKRNHDDLLRFCNEITSDNNINKIVLRSDYFRNRFYNRIKEVVRVEEGETLLLIDLGYNGTVHTLLSPVLARDFKVKCQGLFLMMSASTERFGEKFALINAEKCDTRCVGALTRTIMLFEQISANQSASTVDFTDHGFPVYANEAVPSEQIDFRAEIQRHSIDFVSNALNYGVPHAKNSAVVDETVALIARFLFLPSCREIPAFDNAVHDVNLGTDQTVGIINSSLTNKIVRKRGLLGLVQANRQGVFWELRSRDIDETLHYLSVVRFGVEMAANDYKGNEIGAMIYGINDIFIEQLPTYRTGDGFLRVLVPVYEKVQAIGLMLAPLSRWIQIESVLLVKLNDSFGQYIAEELGNSDLMPSVRFEMGVQHDTGIVEFSGTSGFAFITPASGPEWSDGNHLCEVIFRPLTDGR